MGGKQNTDKKKKEKHKPKNRVINNNFQEIYKTISDNLADVVLQTTLSGKIKMVLTSSFQITA